ncbi:hypothetical protein [Chryseosolibacter indicus]|uniref:DUF4230 domain-containing protein n=1 Tax=Chryseosolibacter indicus TaxID=2782351 RepID=A0ABS5VQ48_9BACT|nr:hypothetical protein [Chryseosolibacter indicus]MBT1703533.1 hypothetical protein [Chryseosolibacter indicus]
MIKHVSYYIVIITLLLACSSRPTQDKAEYSESFNNEEDTTGINYISEEDLEDSYQDDTNTDSLQLLIEEALQNLSEEIESHMHYKLRATLNGFKNGVDAHYYYDSLLNLRYCTVFWSSEGTSGNHTYYFNDNRLIGARENNYYPDSEELILLHVDFKPNFGILKSEDEKSEGTLTYLSESDFISKDMEALKEYNELIKQIKEYKETATVYNETVKLQVQKAVNHRDNFIEQYDFEISPKVYEYLINK